MNIKYQLEPVLSGEDKKHENKNSRNLHMYFFNNRSNYVSNWFNISGFFAKSTKTRDI